MAIEVIKHGKETFKVICSKCGCEFTYQLEDLKEDIFHNHYVECPDCQVKISHKDEAKNREIREIQWGLNPILTLSDGSIDYSQFITPTADLIHKVKTCNDCLSKLDPENPVVGDSPCNWCKNRQPTCE